MNSDWYQIIRIASEVSDKDAFIGADPASVVEPGETELLIDNADLTAFSLLCADRLISFLLAHTS